MLQACTQPIELITKPSHEQLARWWTARTASPEEVLYAFADDSPGFHQFVEAINRGEIICVMTTTEDGDLTATGWLHDLSVDYAGEPRVGWLGGYVFPHYRGALSIPAIHTILGYFENLGIEHIHTSVRVENRRSIFYIRNRRFMGFTEVCTVPNWSKLRGGIHVTRDKLPSIAYSEELIFSISATLQSTDQRHGILGQECCHFQLHS